MSGASLRSFFEKITGTREDFWMKSGNKISVCSCLSVHVDKAGENGKMTKLATRAEKEVERIVGEAGVQIHSKGAFMRSKGRRVTAVGVVEVQWSPEAEMALEEQGLVEAR